MNADSERSDATTCSGLKAGGGVSPAERTAWVVKVDVDVYGKALLFVLAHRADANTGECWITVGRLAHEAGMSERKAQLVVRQLVHIGLLSIDRRLGRKANTYRLVYATNPAQRAPLNRAQRAPLSASNRALRDIQPCTDRHPTVHIVHPEQVLTGIEQPTPPAAASVWSIAKQWLSGGLLGRCIRDYGEENVAQAITATDLKRPADPKAYLLGILKKTKQPEVTRVVNDW